MARRSLLQPLNSRCCAVAIDNMYLYMDGCVPIKFCLQQARFGPQARVCQSFGPFEG